MVTTAKDQFDGAFIHMDARDLRANDVILGGARTVTATPVLANGGVTVDTVTGTEIFDADAMVHVFRPADGRTDEECPGCYAAPGEPCDVMCLSYAALDEAAGAQPA